MGRLLALLLLWPATASANYLVVSLVDAGDPYEGVAAELARLRNADLVRGSSDDLASLLVKLQDAQPEHVAFVVRPEQLNVNLAHRLLCLATQVDEDPFVDFGYGFITGRTPAAGQRLAAAGLHAEKKNWKPEICIAGVAGGSQKKSTSSRQQLPLKGLSLTWHSLTVVDPSANQEKRDTEFIDNMLEQLEGKSMFALAGHGYPDRVVGGPNFDDLRGRDYSGAVAFNIACYTGVTSDWFDRDWKAGKLAGRCVPPDKSFALGMIDTGVAAYVAYSCPRPAGGQMFADMISLATEGISIGEQRRRHANSVILTHLGQGFDGVVAAELHDGQPLRRTTNTDQFVRDMSAGSLLFGDPAFVPFQQTPGAYPMEVNVTQSETQISAVVSVNRMWEIHCHDSLEQMKLRIEGRIPLGDKHIRSLAIDQLPFGNENRPLRVNAATEQHQGERFLHVKALFERPVLLQLRMFGAAPTASFIIETTENVAESKQRFNIK